MSRRFLAYEICCVGRGVAAVRHKSGSRSYTYYAMLALGERFKSYEAEGTVFGAINKKQFQNLPSIAPQPDIVSSFEKLVGAIHELPLQMSQKQRRKMTLPKLIGRFKMLSSKRINKLRNTPGTKLWQRNYYEHIIRNDDELHRTREYIINNPL